MNFENIWAVIEQANKNFGGEVYGIEFVQAWGEGNMVFLTYEGETFREFHSNEFTLEKAAQAFDEDTQTWAEFEKERAETF